MKLFKERWEEADDFDKHRLGTKMKAVLGQVPEHFRKARLSDKSEACEVAREFLEGDDAFLVLAGVPSTGKTHASYGYFIEMATAVDGLSVGYYTVHEMFDALFDKTERRNLLNRSRLVVDDLGAEGRTDAESSEVLVDRIVDNIYRHNGKLLITTNLTAEDFKNRYGKRVSDRIRERGRFYEVKDKNWRTKP